MIIPLPHPPLTKGRGKLMHKRTVRIKKEEFPRPRRFWKRSPGTKVTPSKKIYNRGRAKQNAKRQTENEKNKKSG